MMSELIYQDLLFV